MAIKLGSNAQDEVMAEINVTPMVDVMLVLLIIFMVAAPMMVQGVDVQLPETEGAALDAGENEIILSINKNKQIFFGDEEIKLENLKEFLSSNVRVKEQKSLLLKADKTVDYGCVAHVMSIVQKSGGKMLNLITEPEA